MRLNKVEKINKETDRWQSLTPKQKYEELEAYFVDKNYWIAKYEERGCIDLSDQEKASHTAQEWREMYEALVISQREEAGL